MGDEGETYGGIGVLGDINRNLRGIYSNQNESITNEILVELLKDAPVIKLQKPAKFHHKARLSDLRYGFISVPGRINPLAILK